MNSSVRRYRKLRQNDMHLRCTTCGQTANREDHGDESFGVCGNGHMTPVHAAENTALIVDWMMGLPGYTLNIGRGHVSIVYLDGDGEPEPVATIDPDEMQARMADADCVRHSDVVDGLTDRHYSIVDGGDQ